MLENHDAPCGEGVPAADCPPIKVTNNSHGPLGGGDFDPSSATAKLQRALAAEGLMTVWANGNDGDDGDDGDDGIESSCRPYLPICSSGLSPNDGPAATDIATFNTISGTSMAAPHIAGIIAQLFQAKPMTTPAGVEGALKSSACKYTDGAAFVPVGPYTSAYDKGTGPVDVVAAAQPSPARPRRKARGKKRR